MTYATGIDISRYNVSFDPTIAHRQIDFVFQKATQGTSYIDTLYEAHWAGVSKIPIRGAYHYQQSGMSWLSQANHFLNVTNRHDYQILALDLEEFGNEYNNTFFSDSYRIINYLRDEAPDKKIILYTNGNGYKLMYYSLISQYGYNIINWIKGVPLWFADPTTAGLPHLPTMRETWEIHQYSWSGLPSDWGTGGTRVDENVFNGTVHDMRTWLGMSTPFDSTFENLLNGGLNLETRVYNSPRPITCHIAKINLSKVKSFVVTPPKPNGLLDPKKTSDFSKEYDVDLAVNADEGYPAGNNQLAVIRRNMSAEIEYGTLTDGITTSISKERPYQLATISGPFPEFAYNAISGSKWLVKDGQAQQFEDMSTAARTVIGWTQDKSTMFLMVVDEKLPSYGITLNECAELMKELGCWQAVNEDGSGSSVMVINDSVVSNPSGPTGENLVANHLGIIFEGDEHMTARYEVISTLYNMSLRPEHNSGTLATEVVPANTPMYCDELWTATEDLYKVINGVNTKVNAVGDKWAHVIEVNGVAKNSWVAIIHLGRVYCTVEEITPPPPTPSTSLNLVLDFDDSNNLIKVTVDGEEWVQP